MKKYLFSPMDESQMPPRSSFIANTSTGAITRELNPMKIDLDSVHRIEELGSGAFGTVYKCVKMFPRVTVTFNHPDFQGNRPGK